MTKLAVETLADLSGVAETVALIRITAAGFLLHGTTRGGYREWRHPDGSAIWIRPSGEVIRLGPHTPGKKHRQRYDQIGDKTTTHSTGEAIKL